MSFASLAESVKEMAGQYGYRPRIKGDAAPVVRKRTAPLKPRYDVAKCEARQAAILAAVTRLKQAQKTDFPVCTHNEMVRAIKLLNGKIVYVGHAPQGYWRLK